LSISPQELADRQVITELLYRYCRSVDRLDHQLGHSIWHAGGQADYGDFYKGDGPGVIDLICAQHLHTAGHSHQLANIIIEVDGDRAGSESYVTANLRVEQGETVRQMTVWSRYIDQWEKRDGRWGLVHRLTIRDFDEVRVVTPLSPADGVSRRDGEDPSCRVLRKLPSSFN